jgi:hypothetical protein
MAVRLQSP